ncbi:MAG: arginine decarboxylase [Chitinophagales bacterium]|nr:arginine decarboxylase [Chitinophagales bacterium]
MRDRYIDLIEQTYYFPQDGFEVIDDYLQFHKVDLKNVIEKFGTPLKLTYLPKIGENINKARRWFHDAFENVGYNGSYFYCYCTKSNHFSFVLNEVLKNKAHLETSSAYDIDLIRALYNAGKIDKKIRIIANGFKPKAYTDKLLGLIKDDFIHIIPILDNMQELEAYSNFDGEEMSIGVRVAAEEEPNYQFYTSRLGIRFRDLIPFYIEKIKSNPKLKLRMLHFFIDSGIKDSAYYWSELNKCLNMFVELKKICPTLSNINIGGGLPIRNSLGSNFDYAYVIEEIVNKIKNFCDEAGLEHPNIYTEFGSFTVGESGANIFEIIGQKKQNDSELWYMINGSLMTTIPDVWGLGQRFILLPVNLWGQAYQRTIIGGLSCDVSDYYNSEVHINQVYMPKIIGDQKLYIGFFHTGAYQDSLSGYGGTKHCLLPSPKHIVIDKDEHGKLIYDVFAEEQAPDSMLKTLGYGK